MIIPEKATSDDIKSSSSENIRQVVLLSSGKSQKEPLAANNKSKLELDNFFPWCKYFLQVSS